MKDIEFIRYKDITIVYTNLEGLSSSEAKDVVCQAKDVIQSSPLKSVYSLVNMTNMNFNSDLKKEIRDAGKLNAPFVKVTALVGLNPILKLIAKTVIKLTGRKADLFDDVPSAKEWLYLYRSDES